MTRRKLIAWAGALAFAGVLMYFAGGCVQSERPPAAPRPQPQPKPPPTQVPIDHNRFSAVSMGYLGAQFSGGMKQLVAELRAMGIDARLYEWTQWQQAAADSAGASDVTLVVHSFGGDFASKFASAIAPRTIRVVFALEPTAPSSAIFPVVNPPSKNPNISRYIEVYVVPQTPITANQGPRVIGSEPRTTGVFHTDLDDDRGLRAQAVEAVR